MKKTVKKKPGMTLMKYWILIEFLEDFVVSDDVDEENEKEAAKKVKIQTDSHSIRREYIKELKN